MKNDEKPTTALEFIGGSAAVFVGIAATVAAIAQQRWPVTAGLATTALGGYAVFLNEQFKKLNNK